MICVIFILYYLIMRKVFVQVGTNPTQKLLIFFSKLLVYYCSHEKLLCYFMLHTIIFYPTKSSKYLRYYEQNHSVVQFKIMIYYLFILIQILIIILNLYLNNVDNICQYIYLYCSNCQHKYFKKMSFIQQS